MTELPHRFAEIWSVVQYQLFGNGMRTFIAGSVIHGFQVLSGKWGVLCLVALAGIGVLWVRRCFAQGIPRSNSPLTRSWKDDLLLTIFGASLFVLAWVPVAEIRGHGVATRLFYFPLVGCTIIAAVWLDRLVLAWQRSAHGKVVFAEGAILAAVLILGTVGQVGAQSALRTRYAMDLQVMAELKSLVPNPPPDTVFVPLRVASLPALTGHSNFDDFACSALGTAWSSPVIFQEAYRRRDLIGTFVLNGERFPLRDFGKDSVLYCTDQLVTAGAAPRDISTLSYERMLPFTVDWGNQVRLVDHIRVERPDLSAQEITFPRAMNIEKQNGSGERTVVVQDGDPERMLRPLGPWTWLGSSKSVSFRKHVDWGAENEATSLSASGTDRSRSAMITVLSPSQLPRIFLFRVTLAESDLRYVTSGEIRVTWRLAGPESRVLAEQVLGVSDFRSEQSWRPVRIIVPPHTEPEKLEVTMTPMSPPSPARVRAKVTIGYEQVDSKL